MSETSRMTTSSSRPEGAGSGLIGSDARRMANDPASFFNFSHTEMQSVNPDSLADLQFAALRERFEDLRPRIPVLAKLADKQGIKDLATLDDIVPLLFEHTMYKSYPASLIEKNRFADLTRWLSKLSIHDLSGLDVSQCQGIDDWLTVLDQESPLRISHSSGTSGVMSFLPISKSEWDRFGRIIRVVTLQDFGDPVDHGESDEIYCVFPYFRDGGSGHLRVIDVLEKWLVKGEERVITAYPGRMSSDILHLAGRIRAAQTRGELDRLVIAPRLLERKKEFEKLEAEMPAHLKAFFDRVMEQLRGKRIFMGGTWNLLHGLATRGLELGLENVFAPNSIISTGGGSKGMTPPENWQADVCRFLGVPKLRMSYGMSEVLGMHHMCDQGRYHFVPWVIPFLLDGETSDVLPRRGTATGRAAFYDLSADSRWGGFITGDEITVTWDEPCPCGRSSAFAHGEIRRFSDRNGGDDKISCAATENAHKEAMDFLTAFA